MIGKSTMIFSNKGVSLCWNIDLTLLETPFREVIHIQ